MLPEVRAPHGSTIKKTSPATRHEAKAEAAIKPKFDFYTLLPKLEVVVPKLDQTKVKKPIKEGAAVTHNQRPPSSIKTPGAYMLQVGSFRTHYQAERMKASLALLGIRADIDQVKVKQAIWHRVQIGPFENLAELNALRDTLYEHRINSLVLKMKS